ncbi:MAG: pirin family protein, partial [Polyangiaceae bacterium]|nr:pirin family protein [Polyangiaceae bacterium]
PEGEISRPLGDRATFSEVRLPPGGNSRARAPEEAEIVTYVYTGALAQEDSMGRSGVLQAGEFQRTSTGRGIGHNETNASRTDWAHFFRITLRPSHAGLEYSQEQERFTAAQRRNVLCLVASRDGRRGSLRMQQDAFIYSSILDPGHHFVHELLPGRSARLHLVYGEATLNDHVVLFRGDSVDVKIEPSVSITVQEGSEILLVDMNPTPTSPGVPGGRDSSRVETAYD